MTYDWQMIEDTDNAVGVLLEMNDKHKAAFNDALFEKLANELGREPTIQEFLKARFPKETK